MPPLGGFEVFLAARSAHSDSAHRSNFPRGKRCLSSATRTGPIRRSRWTSGITNSVTGRGCSGICIAPISRVSSTSDRLDAKRAAAAWADGGGNPPRPSRCGSTPASGIERNQNSEAVEAVGASGNGAFARRASCRTCTSCGPAPQGCSHNGVLKHRQASGVASARNGESGAGYAEAPTFRPGQLRPDDRYSSSTTGLRNIPSSGEEISTTSPALSQRGGSARGPSLTGVPVTMTSAGLIVMKVVM